METPTLTDEDYGAGWIRELVSAVRTAEEDSGQQAKAWLEELRTPANKKQCVSWPDAGSSAVRSSSGPVGEASNVSHVPSHKDEAPGNAVSPESRPDRSVDGLKERIRLLGLPQIRICLPSSRTAPGIFDHCIARLKAFIASDRGPTVFKIGATKDPIERWMWPGTGYMYERYELMTVVAELKSLEGCQFLEHYLIRLYKGSMGCQNENPGGEGLFGEPPFYIYIVCRFLRSRRPAS